MSHIRRSVGGVAAALVAVFLFTPVASAALLGEGCYLIPTDSALVRVLVGAQETPRGLVAELTSGERWVLKTFFRLEVERLAAHEEGECL